jgi:hypothetical protein
MKTVLTVSVRRVARAYLVWPKRILLCRLWGLSGQFRQAANSCDLSIRTRGELKIKALLRNG